MPSIVDGLGRLPELPCATDSVGPAACPLARAAAQALLAVIGADATSVIVGAPPLQVGEQMWSLLGRGPRATRQRRYSMASRQIDSLNESRVESSREA